MTVCMIVMMATAVVSKRDQNDGKTAISRRLGKKFLGRSLADRMGRVIRNTCFFSWPYMKSHKFLVELTAV